MEMKIFAIFSIAFAITFYGAPTSASWIIATIDDLGNYVTEDLDVPVPASKLFVFEKNLRYMLYTRENKTNPYQLISGNEENLAASPFDPNRPTKFLIHGWQSSYIAGPLQLAKQAFLVSEDVNCIILDYKKYNAPYVLAVHNAKAIARHFANFIQFLVKQGGLDLKTTHVVGHSLGAHVAGFVGKEMKGKVARVTGLDPAGPFFESSKPPDRMDGSDGVYVDVIYTSTLAGIHHSIGQTNFYPHGGSQQPACASSPIPPACDHVYAWEYFEISITSRSQFPARKCVSEDQAKVADAFANTCKPSTAVMGNEAMYTSPAGYYYVDVSLSN